MTIFGDEQHDVTDFFRRGTSLQRATGMAVGGAFASGTDCDAELDEFSGLWVERSRILCGDAERFVGAHHSRILLVKLAEPWRQFGLGSSGGLRLHIGLLPHMASNLKMENCHRVFS